MTQKQVPATASAGPDSPVAADGMRMRPLGGWGPMEDEACCSLVQLALREDLDAAGDRTSALLPADLQGRAAFVARAEGIVAGLPALVHVYEAVHAGAAIELQSADGRPVKPGRVLATVHGPMRALLTSERTALNFLQRLSGVATLTHRFVEAIAGLRCQILDTRKTTPGWRRLEKYAVRCGGGGNHRFGLFDGVMFKDNHLAALGELSEPIVAAVRRARTAVPHNIPIEVEVETMGQLDEALAAHPDVILLDNMDLPMLREAVRRRDAVAKAIRLEASGGVTLATVRAIAETGVDCISVGALTHSAPALDIALDYLK